MRGLSLLPGVVALVVVVALFVLGSWLDTAGVDPSLWP